MGSKSMKMKTTQAPIIVTKTYNCSTQRLWKALTDISEMRQWYFEDMPDFRPQVGFSTSFLIINEGRHFTHYFEVLEVVREKMIKYTFDITEYEGDGYVVFEIEPSDKGSQLTLTSVVTKPYPEDIPEFKRESGVAGWEWFLGERLMAFVNN